MAEKTNKILVTTRCGVRGKAVAQGTIMTIGKDISEEDAIILVGNMRAVAYTKERAEARERMKMRAAMEKEKDAKKGK